MKWYFCFNERVSGWLADCIKTCVLSAKQNTTLQPHCLYDGKETAVTAWLRDQQVPIQTTAVFFKDELASAEVVAANRGTAYDAYAARGFYLPLQLAIEAQDEHVLYTDTDVVFQRDLELGECRPKCVAACAEVGSIFDPAPPEIAHGGFNSGVMVINTAAWRERKDLFRTALAAGHYYRKAGTQSPTYDQWVLNEVFGSEWDALPPEMNWRAFWPANPDARIVHFHGPKPRQFSEYLDGKSDTLDELTLSILERHRSNYESWYRYFHSFEQSPTVPAKVPASAPVR